MADYTSWNDRFPWVLSVHDSQGRCLYAKPKSAGGRPRIHLTEADKKAAYRKRLAERSRTPKLPNL